MLGDADPVPQSLLVSYPEQAKTLKLLYEVSRELTSILDREELLRRVAESVRKIVDYDVFSVMLWNEQAQLLESVFAMRCNDSIAQDFRLLGSFITLLAGVGRLECGPTNESLLNRQAMSIRSSRLMFLFKVSLMSKTK